jgi:hypothetical protein
VLGRSFERSTLPNVRGISGMQAMNHYDRDAL